MRESAGAWSGVTLAVAAAFGLVGGVGCDQSSPTTPTPSVPTPPPIVTVPSLLAPPNGSALGNDCTGDSWSFDWSDVPGATTYHISVRDPGGAMVIDDAMISGSSYRWTREPSIVADADRHGWRWRVRAMVAGTWREWSAESAFDVDPLYPRPVFPAPGAVMDNGCTNFSDQITWEFHWSACASASRYHLFVIGGNATIPVVDDDRVRDPDYGYAKVAWIGDTNRLGWRWRVRARFADGWGDWTPERTFNVEPVNSDCPR